jgi:hypothetical protein
MLQFAGVSNTSTLYKRGIRICTGTGLGAALSTCLQSPDWYLIWIGSDQEKTFGPTISRLIHDNLGPERLCLWDTRARDGRPDVMKLVKDAYKSWGAEVVFITSNYQGNQEIMEGCKEAGIPAFVSRGQSVRSCMVLTPRRVHCGTSNPWRTFLKNACCIIASRFSSCM